MSNAVASSRYGVNVNVAFFDYYREGDREYVGRSWLIAPSEVERNVRVGSGKRALLSFEELASLADERGVGDLYKALAYLRGRLRAVVSTASHRNGPLRRIVLQIVSSPRLSAQLSMYS
jgi:hypothetical protein